MPRFMIFMASLMVGLAATVVTVVLSPELRASAGLAVSSTVVESAAVAFIPAVAGDGERAQPVVRPARVAANNARSLPEQPRPRAISEAAVAAPRTAETAVERKRTAMPYGIYVPPF